MKKAIKLINCLIFFGLVSNFSFAESYKNFVNEEIASELGISERTVSESVKILEKLQLIVYKEAYHIKNEEDKI